MAVAIREPVGGERRRFTVEEYHRMAAAGILRPDERVELLDGEIVRMSPIGSRHAGRVERLRDLLRDRAGGRALVRGQNPVRLSGYDEPQPDLAVVRVRADYYEEGHPTAAEILLLIEVADTTLAPDRRQKLPIYAAAGVRETWLLDVQGEALEVYREPGPQGYAQKRLHRRGERVAPAALPELVLDVAELVPATRPTRRRTRTRPGPARPPGAGQEA
jgi:Uma2 family endonuclease